MENKGNGQVIFVEPLWVTGETCLFNVTNPVDYAFAKKRITKFRSNFIKKLESEGFVNTYDRNDLRDKLFFIMDSDVCEYEPGTKEYKNEFNKRMFEAGGTNLNYPYSLYFLDYLNNPFYPAVLKNESVNGGIDKFFIENEEQLNILKKFYSDFKNNDDIKFLLEDNCIFQQFIETPTEYKTYLRVLMSASGDMMGASLKFSHTSSERNEPNGILENYFWNEKSKYFLNAKKMFNYYSGGENIFFSQPKYSDIKKRVLISHGINPSNPVLPEEVYEVSSNIAKKCNAELGIIVGIDFIYNVIDSKWYYLENQAFPAVEEWAVTKGIKIKPIKNINDYLDYMEYYDIKARYEALLMYMNKKNHENIFEDGLSLLKK